MLPHAAHTHAWLQPVVVLELTRTPHPPPGASRGGVSLVDPPPPPSPGPSQILRTPNFEPYLSQVLVWLFHKMESPYLAPPARVWYKRGMEQVRTTGRAAQPVEYEILGELTPVDLSLLDEERGTKPTALKRISERHHALARHIAGGMRLGEAAVVTGYDIARISILQNDPSFQDLVKFYKAEAAVAYQDAHVAAAGLKLDVINELRERIEEHPEKFKTPELTELFKSLADRTGQGPSSTQKVDIHVGLGERLEAARRRVESRTIEITANSEAAE